MRRAVLALAVLLAVCVSCAAAAESVNASRPLNTYAPDLEWHDGMWRWKVAPSAAASALDASNWMSQNKPLLNGLTLRDMTLPGSHDSGAYSLTALLSPDAAGTDGLTALIALAEKLGLPINYIITPWALAQTGTVAQQLQAGIRYIDLRICWDGTDFRVYHFETGNLVSVVLSDIGAFVAANPEEIVIVEAQLLQPVNHTVPDAAKTQLVNSLLSTFQGVLYPQQSAFSHTYAQLLANQWRVLVTIDDGNMFNQGRGQLWQGWGANNANNNGPATIFNTWGNSADLPTTENYNTERVSQYNHGFQNGQPDQFPSRCVHGSSASGLQPCLFKLSWTLTPDEHSFLGDFDPKAPHSLVALSASVLAAWDGWLTSSSGAGPYAALANIIISDDVLNPNNHVVQTAIKRTLQGAQAKLAATQKLRLARRRRAAASVDLQ